MTKSELIASLDPFTQSYITALLWSEMDESNPDTGGEPLDAHYCIYDLTAKALTTIKADCEAFQRDNAALLAQAGDKEQNGHDFLLTRNGHGTGFWDRGYEDGLGNRLTEAAHKAGETHAYVQGGKVGVE